MKTFPQIILCFFVALAITACKDETHTPKSVPQPREEDSTNTGINQPHSSETSATVSMAAAKAELQGLFQDYKIRIPVSALSADLMFESKIQAGAFEFNQITSLEIYPKTELSINLASHLSHLQEVELHYFSSTAKTPRFLKYISNLQTLKFVGIEAPGRDESKVGSLELFKELRSLKKLELNFSESVVFYPAFYSIQLPQLEHLAIRSTSFTCIDGEYFSQTPNLKKLELYNFGCPGGYFGFSADRPLDLNHVSRLDSLTLETNNIFNIHHLPVPTYFKANSLKELNLVGFQSNELPEDYLTSSQNLRSLEIFIDEDVAGFTIKANVLSPVSRLEKLKVMQQTRRNNSTNIRFETGFDQNLYLQSIDLIGFTEIAMPTGAFANNKRLESVRLVPDIPKTVDWIQFFTSISVQTWGLHNQVIIETSL